MQSGDRTTSTDPRSPGDIDNQVDLIFKALASKTRRDILALLAGGAGKGDARYCSDEEACACIFVEKLGLGAPTVSHHMKALLDAGLISAEKRGLWVYYRLRADGMARLRHELDAFTGCANGECH